MSFEYDTRSPSRHSPDRGRPGRPQFSSSKTSDRLRESDRRPSSTSSTTKLPRRSVFKEEGLDDLNHSVHPSHDARTSTIPAAEHEEARGRNTTFDDILKGVEVKHFEESGKTPRTSSWYSKMARPKIKTSATAPPGTFSSVSRTAFIVFLIACVVPGFRYSTGRDKVNISGADAGVIMTPKLVDNGSLLEGRQNSPTDVCTRWSHMTANVNGTLYIYGGEATTTSGQTENKWNNNFLTLDLTKSWNIASPSISGLPQPSGPPAVAMGYLWQTYDSLFLYGGEFSDSPPESPLPVSTWEYDLKSASWTEHSNPTTSAGNSSDGGNTPVQRSAEGAGLSVPELGKSWYFGGHLDLYTTEGWSNQIARVYLKSLLEFTHPGYGNTGVDSLGSKNAAPEGGVYRNITEGGLQAEAGFTERADGVLVYVPGWGEDGILLGLAGGTNETFTEMNVIDVYDIANSTWYKQSTSGTSPPIRVDPCAVVAAAPDGTSFNVYLYGGQNLIPFGSQIQYSDMWILTIPSFTWVQVDMTGQSQPPARAGHTCSIWDGQMVVVGGYVGQDISCDSPGIYVFNTSSLQWSNTFTSLSGSPSGSDSGASGDNPAADSSVFQGSYGYEVPGIVQSVIGGSSLGGATATTPAAGSATAGPIATGKPPTFTVTQSGSTVIQTAHSTSTVSAGAPASSGDSKSSEPVKKETNVGAIAAGVTAGAFACLAVYLAFCTWLYRRQLKIYKDHVAMGQRSAFAASPENGEDWASAEGGGSGNGAMRMSQIAGGPMLGPFGTAIRPHDSANSSPQRPSMGGESTGSQNLTPAATNSGHTSGQGSFVQGGGATLGPSRYGPYGRLSEENEDTTYHGASHMAPSTSTAHSSMDDLLGGQEPSFFSVVLNPRRTLRVVNSD